jgi:acylphosphatase
VQGVFFRDSCLTGAQAAGVAGWVTNEPDGSVRARFEGPVEAVERLVAWSHEGPSGADVDRVVAREVPTEGLSGFEVR